MSSTTTEKIEIMSSTKNEKIEINMEKGLKTMDHEIRVNGYCLTERKALVHPYIVPAHGKVTKLVVHSRFIDDRSYTVEETFPLTEGNICVSLPGIGNFTSEGNDEPNRVVKTEMTQEQVGRFQEDWINMWNPEIDETFFD